MKALSELTTDEKSLLLFFEDCAVNKSGRVDAKKMNEEDLAIAQSWDASGFAEFGRITLNGASAYGANWCKLSDDAWTLAAQERKARANRLWKNRSWQTTKEKREQS